MAINILPPEGGFGSTFGTGLGAGLGEALKGFGQGQAKQGMAQLYQAQGLPGALAYMPEQAQAAYLRNFGASQQMAQKQRSEAEAVRDFNDEGQGDNSFINNLNNLNNSQQQVPSGNELFNMMNQVPEGVSENFAAPQLQPNTQQQINKQPSYLASISKLPSLKESPIIPQQKRLNNLNKRIEEPNKSDATRIKLRDRIDKEEEKYTKFRDRAFDQTKTIRSDITKGARDAQDVLDLVDRNLDLVKKGEMNTPGTLKLLEEIGFDTSALQENDTQEFIKNNQPFLKPLKSIFGGNVTTQEMQTFLKGIANEFQTPEGQRRILESFKKGARGGVLRFDVMDSIINANNRVPTETLESDIEKIAAPELKKIKKDYLKELRKKPLPDSESKYVTAAKQFAGKALAAAPDMLKRTAKGAALAGAYTKTPQGALLGGLAGFGGLI